VGGVDHFRPGDSREQIFCSTRKADHFVRECRTEDENVIIFQRDFVDADVHAVRQGRMPIISCNGFDLTVREISAFQTRGKIAVSNTEREISRLSPLQFDDRGFLSLEAGSYVVTYNEIVNLPKNITALGAPRSSLLRCGVTLQLAIKTQNNILNSFSSPFVFLLGPSDDSIIPDSYTESHGKQNAY
jgi:hypothetical protein